MEAKEPELWKNGYDISLQRLKEEFKRECGRSFLHFIENLIDAFIQ